MSPLFLLFIGIGIGIVIGAVHHASTLQQQQTNVSPTLQNLILQLANMSIKIVQTTRMIAQLQVPMGILSIHGVWGV